jgi:hypothetical protein
MYRRGKKSKCKYNKKKEKCGKSPNTKLTWNENKRTQLNKKEIIHTEKNTMTIKLKKSVFIRTEQIISLANQIWICPYESTRTVKKRLTTIKGKGKVIPVLN